jgi:PIN domain
MANAEPPEQRPGILYVDTSALLKLLVREAESTAIERALVQWPSLATSIITEVELPRAVARAREDRPDTVIDGSLILQGVLASAAMIDLSEDIVAGAKRGSGPRRSIGRDTHSQRTQPRSGASGRGHV